MNRSVILIAASLAAAVVVGALVLRRPALVSDEAAPAMVPAASSAPAVAAPAAIPAPASEAPARTARPSPKVTADAPEPAAPVAEAPPPAASDVATLRIDSDVPGAQVFIDRQFVGTAPVTAADVKPGSHQLNVSAEGFEGIAQTLEVVSGPRDIMVRFREVRLNAKVAVIHKHRIGSCKGELLATPQGLRYVTADKDDGFAVSLSDLDTFEVDYLEKNLKVKLRKGKQFNFTDPAGNADRLFVFHRDVEKARDRIRKGEQPAP